MKALLLIALLSSGPLALAHGEDRHGPNGGFIRMPGAFHTEVVPQGAGQIRVYLLDIDWKNPSVDRSSVNAKLTDKNIQVAKCSPEANYFVCGFEKPASLARGRLVIEATREGQKGNAVTYPLPLKLESASHKDH